MVFGEHIKSSNSMKYVSSGFGHREIRRTETIFILLCQNLCSLKNGISKHKYILSSYHCISVQRKQRMSTRYRGNTSGLARGVEQFFNGLQDEDGTNSEENTLTLVSAQTSAHSLLEESERDAGKQIILIIIILNYNCQQ